MRSSPKRKHMIYNDPSS